MSSSLSCVIPHRVTLIFLIFSGNNQLDITELTIKTAEATGQTILEISMRLGFENFLAANRFYIFTKAEKAHFPFSQINRNNFLE